MGIDFWWRENKNLVGGGGTFPGGRGENEQIYIYMLCICIYKIYHLMFNQAL